MSDQEPPKKVVKRVVKRAVAQPPTMRYGRPVAPPTQASDVPRTEPTPSPPTSVETIETKRSSFRPSIKRPQVKAPHVDLGAVRERTSRTAASITSTGRRASRSTADFAVDRWYDLRVWWLPTVEPKRASAITGLLMGLLAVGLGAGALALFSQVRGVASGGGTWGSLTFVVVAFVAFAAGERLLAGFGTPMPRLTSFLGITLTLVAILGVLLGVADSVYAIVVVPLVTAAGYLAAHWLLALAESTPPERD